jgi:hypothetical protein
MNDPGAEPRAFLRPAPLLGSRASHTLEDPATQHNRFLGRLDQAQQPDAELWRVLRILLADTAAKASQDGTITKEEVDATIASLAGLADIDQFFSADRHGKQTQYLRAAVLARYLVSDRLPGSPSQSYLPPAITTWLVDHYVPLVVREIVKLVPMMECTTTGDVCSPTLWIALRSFMNWHDQIDRLNGASRVSPPPGPAARRARTEGPGPSGGEAVPGTSPASMGESENRDPSAGSGADRPSVFEDCDLNPYPKIRLLAELLRAPAPPLLPTPAFEWALQFVKACANTYPYNDDSSPSDTTAVSGTSEAASGTGSLLASPERSRGQYP